MPEIIDPQEPITPKEPTFAEVAPELAACITEAEFTEDHPPIGQVPIVEPVPVTPETLREIYEDLLANRKGLQHKSWVAIALPRGVRASVVYMVNAQMEAAEAWLNRNR